MILTGGARKFQFSRNSEGRHTASVLWTEEFEFLEDRCKKLLLFMGSERRGSLHYFSFIIHLIIIIIGETSFVFPTTMVPFYVIGVIKGNEER